MDEASQSGKTKSLMKIERLLVVFHVFYHDQVDYYIDKLKNINGCQWDLVVTCSTCSEETERKLKAFAPDVRIIEVENVGYDVWPFIKALRSVDLADYGMLLKLHTKNVNVLRWKANGLKMRGSQWRDVLVDSMLRSPEQFRRCLELFRKHKDTGMVCSYELLVGFTQRRREDLFMLKDEAERLGISTRGRKFCAGTMFAVRPECMKKIVESYVGADSWPTYSPSHSKGTLAHVYERLLSLAVTDSGFKIRTLTAYKRNFTAVFMHNLFTPVLKSIFTIDRYGEDGRKYLTLLGMRFPLSRREN